MSTPAHRWLSGRDVPNAQVTIIDGGIAIGRRTGVSHHIADAAEITTSTSTVLVARWLCGATSVDAVMAPDGDGVDCVGCRLAAVVPQRPCVYYAWGEGDELLYIGSTINAAQRIRSHSTQTPWWPEVRRLTFDEHASEVAARQAEADAIRERPGVHNRASRRGKGGGRASVLGLVTGESA